MAEQLAFTLKQIVWAKVPEYPWWPAKIVKTLRQHSRNIYKVHFFGDPTYCYLQAHQLLTFQEGSARLKEEQANDFKLRRPIQLAQAAYKKGQLQKPANLHSPECFQEAQPHISDSIEETKIESKPSIENTERIEDYPKTTEEGSQNEMSVLDQFTQINTQNVIDILHGSAFKQLKFLKGYANKKTAQALKTQLKASLLSKYRLDSLHGAAQGSFDCSRPLKPQLLWKRQLIKKPKKVSPSLKKDISAMRKKCIVSLHRILKGSNLDLTACSLHQKAIQIVSRMQQKYPLNSRQFQRQFKSFLHWLKENQANSSSSSMAPECVNFHSNQQLNEDSFFCSGTISSTHNSCFHLDQDNTPVNTTVEESCEDKIRASREEENQDLEETMRIQASTQIRE